MASVVGLLEERELDARERVEVLQEKAHRVLAELAEAESDWQVWLRFELPCTSAMFG